MMQVHTLKLPLANAYLLENEAGLYLVDAGAPGDAGRIRRRMEQLGRKDLRLIYLTHAHIDHFGAAAELQRQTGAPIAIHPADAHDLAHGKTSLGGVRGRGRFIGGLLPALEWLLPPEPVKADLLAADGTSFVDLGLPARAIHTPGHTPGSSCLMTEDGLVFAGDLVSTTGGPHPQRFFADSWEQVHESLSRLQALAPRLAYPGHGPWSLTKDEVAALRLEV
jgi:glyoxylase-like metal-dependent hydrolase (beta-lactamase superfamily II)